MKVVSVRVNWDLIHSIQLETRSSHPHTTATDQTPDPHEFVGRPRTFQEKQRKWRKVWREQEEPFAKVRGEEVPRWGVEEHQRAMGGWMDGRRGGRQGRSSQSWLWRLILTSLSSGPEQSSDSKWRHPNGQTFWGGTPPPLSQISKPACTTPHCDCLHPSIWELSMMEEQKD